MNILIAGATGRVAKYVIEGLLERAYIDLRF